MFCGLNTLFVALCNDERFRALDFSDLQVTLSGGMALTHDAANRWAEVTTVGYPRAGLTETSPTVSASGSSVQIGTIGVRYRAPRYGYAMTWVLLWGLMPPGSFACAARR